jgi:hypothetical protein
MGDFSFFLDSVTYDGFMIRVTKQFIRGELLEYVGVYYYPMRASSVREKSMNALRQSGNRPML